MRAALIVLAKAPVPGRVKTRLCPPCTPAQASALAAAALADTLRAVAATPVARRVCVLDGDPGPWLPHGVEVVPQRGGGLDERLAAAFADVAQPALLIGMDTPQVTAAQLTAALARLERTDAVLGLAPDGGYWAVGLHRAGDALFRGVPMSHATTASAQLARLERHGLQVGLLDALRDVDTIADARAVAAACPAGSAFATALAAVEAGLGGAEEAA